MGRAFVIAVTGGIGAGKSTVCDMLGRRGALVIDADAHAHRALERPDVVAAVVSRYGQRALAQDGTIDRAELAALAFVSLDAVGPLNAIVHPIVTDTVLQQVREASGGPGAPGLVVLDIPLLTAVPDIRRRCDAVVAVEAPLEERMARLEKRGLDREEAARRIHAQPSDEQRRAIATDVLLNDGTTAQLEEAVDRLWQELSRRAHSS